MAPGISALLPLEQFVSIDRVRVKRVLHPEPLRLRRAVHALAMLRDDTFQMLGQTSAKKRALTRTER